jgi:phage host-nuclease inhibitor protein Gam
MNDHTHDPEVLAEIGIGDAADLTRGTPIDLDVRADQLLYRLGKIHVEIKRNEEVADARLQPIREWLTNANEQLLRQASYTEYLIKQIGEVLEFGNKRSRQLPSGRIGFRKAPARVEITDAAGALEFAQLSGLPIDVKQSVSKTTLKAHIETTGELPPADSGIVYVEPRDLFFITPSEPLA